MQIKRKGYENLSFQSDRFCSISWALEASPDVITDRRVPSIFCHVSSKFTGFGVKDIRNCYFQLHKKRIFSV